MGYRFSLATLLRMREIAEQREEGLLGQIQIQIAQSRQTLANVQNQRVQLCVQRESALQQSTSAFEILGFYGQLKQIDELEEIGREQIKKLETLREQQMKNYETAHRNRELLSGMKDDQFKVFQREQIRHEQSAMDDNFSSRRRLH